VPVLSGITSFWPDGAPCPYPAPAGQTFLRVLGIRNLRSVAKAEPEAPNCAKGKVALAHGMLAPSRKLTNRKPITAHHARLRGDLPNPFAVTASTREPSPSGR
jgi:hypothetical protein